MCKCSDLTRKLHLRTCTYQSFACRIALVFCKILDKSCREVFSFFFPLGSISISISGVENVFVNARKLCGNFKVEVRDFLCGCIFDVAAQNSVDNTSCIAD